MSLHRWKPHWHHHPIALQSRSSIGHKKEEGQYPAWQMLRLILPLWHLCNQTKQWWKNQSSVFFKSARYWFLLPWRVQVAGTVWNVAFTVTTVERKYSITLSSSILKRFAKRKLEKACLNFRLEKGQGICFYYICKYMYQKMVLPKHKCIDWSWKRN